jgi:hypothetical protein
MQLNKVQGFLHEDEISKGIQRCHQMLTDCLASFQVYVILSGRMHTLNVISAYFPSGNT